MKKLVHALLIISLLSSVMIGGGFFAQPVSASTHPASCKTSAVFLGVPSWHKYLEVKKVNDQCEVVGPMMKGKDNEPVLDWGKVISRVSLAVIEILLRVGGMVAVGFVIYGGFVYILSQGEPDKTRMAKGTILNAVIGLVIAMLSVAVVNLLARSLIT